METQTQLRLLSSHYNKHTPLVLQFLKLNEHTQENLENILQRMNRWFDFTVHRLSYFSERLAMEMPSETR